MGDFIEEALERAEGVLVQSVKGESRSCCILAAYMMKKYKWSLQKTMDFLAFRRPNPKLNPGFLRQLTNYEQRLISQSGLQLSSSWDQTEPHHFECDELILKNTFVNCQPQPMSDVQLSPHVAAATSRNIQWAENIADVKLLLHEPVVADILDELVSADRHDIKSRMPVRAGPPILKSALKASVRSSEGAKGNLTSEDESKTDGTILIHRRSGAVRCRAKEIIPKRFGLQLHCKTILLEYVVPRCGLRAHHKIRVDLDGSCPCSVSLSGVTDICNTSVAKHLQHEHAPWLAGISTEQLASLVGHLRCSGG